MKKPTEIAFKSLKEALADPTELLVLTDFGKFEVPSQMHLAFQTLHAFAKENGKIPAPWDQDDAQKFATLAKQVCV